MVQLEDDTSLTGCITHEDETGSNYQFMEFMLLVKKLKETLTIHIVSHVQKIQHGDGERNKSLHIYKPTDCSVEQSQ